MTFSLPIDADETLHSHRTYKYITKIEAEIFVAGNHLIKLTKKCLKASFLESLIKEYE